MNAFGVGRVYELFAATDADASERRRVVRLLTNRRSVARPVVPAFDVPITSFSLTKDLLALKRGTQDPVLDAYVRAAVDRFRVKEDQLEALRWWVDGERELQSTIDRGAALRRAKTMKDCLLIFGNELSFFAHVISALASVDIPVESVYLSGSPVAFRIGSARRGIGDTLALKWISGLMSSPQAARLVFADAAIPPLRSVVEAVLGRSGGDRSALDVAVERATDLWTSYVWLVEEDRDPLLRDPTRVEAIETVRRFDKVDGALRRVYERDKGRVARETRVRQPRRLTAPRKVIERVLAFANGLLSTDRQRGEWTRRLMAISPRTIRADARELPELHREIRDILTHLSSGDRWAADPHYPAYRELASDGKWKLPGLGEFDEEIDEAFTWTPVSTDFRWSYADPFWSEQLVVEDLRSGVLMAFREAMKSFVQVRTRRVTRRLIAKCPVCGKFFMPEKRVYCDHRCTNRANDALRARV